MISCPHCGMDVEISEAFKHQVIEQVKKESLQKFEEDIKKARKEAYEKARLESVEQNKDSQKLITEQKEEAKKLREQLSELMDKFSELKTKDDNREIELKKKLLEERERIQEEVSKAEKEKADIDRKDLQKQLDDTKKLLEDARRKAEQKSQQLQGEVMELEVEDLLKSSFPHDEVVEVEKGTSGADIKHIVKSPRGVVCGIILWEFKRTKDWSDKWIGKLKEDLREANANIPVIVSIDLPDEASAGFGVKEGVWICGMKLVLPLADILRKNLLDVGYQKAVSANKESKAEQLYSYAISHEFQQQVERIVEAYKETQDQIIKERVAFEKIWKQREAQAQRIIMSTASIVGSIQGKVGASMPPIKGLELSDGIEETEQKTLLE